MSAGDKAAAALYVFAALMGVLTLAGWLADVGARVLERRQIVRAYRRLPTACRSGRCRDSSHSHP